MHLLARLGEHEPAILQAILERVAERADREPWLLLSVAGADAAMRSALSDESAAWSTARASLRGGRLEEGRPPHEQLRAWCESTDAMHKRIRRLHIARTAKNLTRHVAFYSALNLSVNWLASTVTKHICNSSRSTVSRLDVAVCSLCAVLSTAIVCAPQVRESARVLMYAPKGL